MEQSPTKPVQKFQTAMDFPDAMREVIGGNKVRRSVWPEGEYAFMGDGYLKICRNGNYAWTVNDGDLLAMDWITI